MPPEPSVLVLVGVAGWLYWRGLRTLWRKSASHARLRARALWFAAGLVTIVVALESPLDELSASLFSAHMVQHLVLLLLAGPLLVLGAPIAPWAWALPTPTRRSIARVAHRAKRLGGPALAFALHSLALWLWHIPPLYDAALGNRLVHVAEHTTFLATSALFWWSVLRAGRSGYGAAALWVFALALQSTLLGALLTFAPQPWYASHRDSTLAYGISALMDQQIAGLIMWVPGGLVYLATALGLFSAWLRSSGPRPARTPGQEARIPAHR